LKPISNVFDFYCTYNSPEVSTYFELQLMLAGPVANMLPHFFKYEISSDKNLILY